MKFIKADSSEVVGHVYESILKALKENKRVLWLVSGGSAISLEVDILKRLNAHPKQLQYLAVMQVDERFGPIGHEDSNWKQLEDAGFVDGYSTFIPILQGKDLESTGENYERVLEKVLQEAEYTIGLFGIGTDGHTAGILPHSEATHEDTGLVATYQGPDYTRVTITARVISRLNTAIVYAAGSAKEKMLRTLQQENIAFEDQPAQILKSVKDSYVYNDNLEGEI